MSNAPLSDRTVSVAIMCKPSLFRPHSVSVTIMRKLPLSDFEQIHSVICIPKRVISHKIGMAEAFASSTILRVPCDGVLWELGPIGHAHSVRWQHACHQWKSNLRLFSFGFYAED